MSFAERRQRWLDRRTYAQSNAIMIGLWLLASIATAIYAPAIPIWIVSSISAVIWSFVSARRIAATRLRWLHLAPYLSVAGGYDLFWALIESANDGPWVIGFKPWPWWEYPLQIAGIPAALAWPAATIALVLVKPERPASEVFDAAP